MLGQKWAPWSEPATAEAATTIECPSGESRSAGKATDRYAATSPAPTTDVRRAARGAAERVRQVLADLAALCRTAVAEGKAVLMWMCL
jgi:hypothetical protein